MKTPIVHPTKAVTIPTASLAARGSIIRPGRLWRALRTRRSLVLGSAAAAALAGLLGRNNWTNDRWAQPRVQLTAEEVPVAQDRSAHQPTGATSGEIPPGTVMVSLTFDDGFLSQVQFLELLAALQLDTIKATFFINSSRLNLELNQRPSRDHVEYAPLDIWRQAERDGHEIGAHTVSHLDLSCTEERFAAGTCQPGHSPLSAHERQRQVCSDGQMLRNLGFDVRSFAYPFGHDRLTPDDPSLHDLVARCGFEYGRVTNGLRRGFDEVGSLPVAEALPPSNPYAIRSYRSLDRDVHFEDIRQWILDASADGGGWVPLVLHHVSEDCSAPDNPTQALGVCVLRAELELLLRWLGRLDPYDAAPDNVVVEPLARVMQHFGRPGLAVVANAGMEEVHSGSIERPNCYDRFSGRHESNFEWSSEQLERARRDAGTFGDPTDVSGHFEKLIPTAGNRTPQVRMTTRDDRCYLPVSPQTKYRVQLRARSRSSDDQPVFGRFVFRVLNLPGDGAPFDPVWSDWAIPAVPNEVGPEWATYSMTLPQLPDNAVALAFGYQYLEPWLDESIHEIWIDDFSAIEYH